MITKQYIEILYLSPKLETLEYVCFDSQIIKLNKKNNNNFNRIIANNTVDVEIKCLSISFQGRTWDHNDNSSQHYFKNWELKQIFLNIKILSQDTRRMTKMIRTFSIQTSRQSRQMPQHSWEDLSKNWQIKGESYKTF